MGEVIRFQGNVAADPAPSELTLADRLAMVLSEIVDEPLLTLPHDAGLAGRRPLGLRLAHFRPDLAERASELLEEAGW